MASHGTSSSGNSEEGSGGGHQVMTGVTPKSTAISKLISADVLNDYVMEHILGYLPLSDLKNCRLVNHSWNQASHRVILKKDHVLVFCQAGSVELPGQKTCTIADIPKLIQLIQNSSQFPWTKFGVHDAAIVRTAEDQQQFVNLLRVIAPFAREIGVQNLTVELFPENLEYPALRSLKLQYNQVTIPSERIQNCALGIVGQSPNLDELVLTGLQMMPVFMNILELPNCHKITRLSIWAKMKAEQLVKLSEMGFQLKYLRLTFFLSNLNLSLNATVQSVSTLLQSQSNCLEEVWLNLWLNGDYILKMRVEWPRMEKLKMLRVLNPNLDSGEFPCKDHFPAVNLPTHSIFVETEHGETFFFDGFGQIDPWETVETFKFGWKVDGPGRIFQAAGLFPKLRKLQFKPARNSLNVLGQVMPCLEEVVLLVGAEDNLDEILTGFSSDEIRTINGLPFSQMEVLERSREPLPFLKSLKKLRLETSNTNGQIRITDLACRFALLKMEHLKILEIAGNCRHIRDQVMEAMKNKFVVVVEN